VSLLHSTAGHFGHFIDVLVLVLHGCAHARVSHDIHDRKQVFGRPIHLSSKAMTRAVEDEVVWQPGLLSGFLELLSDRCQMPIPCRAILIDALDKMKDLKILAGARWDPTWSKNRGRLQIVHPKDRSPLFVVEAMEQLIRVTYKPVDRYLNSNKIN
jgi:hypothetical protein